MSDLTKEHTLIVGNILAEIKYSQKGKSCNSFSNDFRALVDDNLLFDDELKRLVQIQN